MHIELSKKEMKDLEKVAHVLNVDPDHAAKLIITMGSAYIAEVVSKEASWQELSIFVHGLLQVPRFPHSVENN